MSTKELYTLFRARVTRIFDSAQRALDAMPVSENDYVQHEYVQQQLVHVMKGLADAIQALALYQDEPGYLPQSRKGDYP
jgi:hypothetical protein